MLHSGSVRRRQAGVLLVGATEPEIQPWLRAAGHAIRAVRGVAEALAALDDEPADLVDRRPRARGPRRAAECCRVLREDAAARATPGCWRSRSPAQGRMADAALDAGADDYLHRPFTPRRAARPRPRRPARRPAALRRLAAARADGQRPRRDLPLGLARGHTLELISDEIERISGYPAAQLHRQRRRTLISIVHPDDRERVLRRRSPTRRTRGEPFALEYRIVRADGEVRWVLDRGQLVHGPGGRLWMDGAIFDITERREAEEALRRREIEDARTEELRASRARIVEAADAARRKIERDLHDGAQQRLVTLALEVRLARARGREATREPRRRSSSASARSSPRRRRSCASWPAASTPRC